MMEGETSFLSDQARGDDLGQQFYSLATWKNKKDRSLKVAPHKHTHVPALPPSPGVEACGALHTAVPGPGSWCLLTRLHPQVNSVSWFCSLTYSTTHSCFCPANQHPRTLSINRLGTNYSNKSKDKDGGGGPASPPDPRPSCPGRSVAPKQMCLFPGRHSGAALFISNIECRCYRTIQLL